MDGKALLNILKPPKKGAPPKPGKAPYDALVLARAQSAPVLKRSRDPSLLILCGPPGCGKSTIKKELLREFGIGEHVSIDPDETRIVLMAQGVTFPNDKTMGGITNNYNKRLADHAMAHEHNIVFDTTGQNFGAVSGLVREAAGRGYNTYFVVVYASLETCQRRVAARNAGLEAAGSGRIALPLEVAAGIYAGFMRPKGTASMYLLDYPVKVKQMLLYSNDVDGAAPQLLYRRVDGKVQTAVGFKGFYNMDIVPHAPYLVKAAAGGGRGRRRSTRRRGRGRKGRGTRRCKRRG